MSARTLMDQLDRLYVREKEMLADFEKEPTAEKRANLDKINADIELIKPVYDQAVRAAARGVDTEIRTMADCENMGGEWNDTTQTCDMSMAAARQSARRAPRNQPGEGRLEDRAKDHATKVNGDFRKFLERSVNGDHGGETFSFKGLEFRAGLEATTNTLGGYTVPQEQFNAELIRAVHDEMVMPRLARTFTVVNADSLGTPSLDSNMTYATWGTELSIGATDTGATFGKRSLTPVPLAAAAVISKKLLRASALPIEGIVREELAYAAARPAEIAYLNGSGANQPLGCFTVSSLGVSTARDITSAASSGSISSYEELVDTKYGIKPQYWGRGSWLLNVYHHKDIRKIKDTNGNPAWMPAGLGTVLSAPSPDILLDSPVYVTQYAPVSTTYGSSNMTPSIVGGSTATPITGRVALYGDFSRYWIATALDLQIEHLVEIKALTAQDIFIMRAESDGMPVLAEAFAPLRLKGY